jgi:hypothetical protein
MILLETIIEVVAGPMLDTVAHGLTDCSWIGTVPIGCDRLWCMTNPCSCLPEKPLSCFHIPLLTQHGINQVAIVVDGTIPITPFAMDFDVCLIHIPGSAGLPLPLDA